jgi:hypothetical protein
MNETAETLGVELNKPRAEAELIELSKQFDNTCLFYKWMLKNYKAHMAQKHGRTLPLWEM